MPHALLTQLADGGTLIVPVGEADQTLYKVTRRGDEFDTSPIEAVRFVPLVAGDLA